jgi:hypothetical protein
MLPSTWNKQRVLITKDASGSAGSITVVLPKPVNEAVYEDYVYCSQVGIIVSVDKFESDNQTDYGQAYWRFIAAVSNNHSPALPDTLHPPRSYQSLYITFANPDGTPFTGPVMLEVEIWCKGRHITDTQQSFRSS